MQHQPKKENTNRSLEKALQVLLILRESGQGQGITDLCRATKFPPGTMYRIILTLRKMNFVAQDPATKKYTLGSAVRRLSMVGMELVSLKNNAQTILCTLRDRTGETSHLYVRRGLYREHVAFVESLQELRVSGRVGDQAAIHEGAASRVLWAFDTDEEIRAMLDSMDLSRSTVNTITDIEELFKEAKNIRKLGYAISYGERHPSIGSIAAPVFDAGSKVVGAISISMPSVRFSRKHIVKFIPDLLWATKALGAALRKNAERENNHEANLPRHR